MNGGQAGEYSAYLAPLHDMHVIGINNIYRIGTWIDILFFGDCGWYLAHKGVIADFPKLKVTCCDRFANKSIDQSEGIKYLAKDKQKTRGISDDPSTVSWNGNSGAAAISMAVHLGVKKIVLLGFDMSLDANNVSHWHGSHYAWKQGGKKRSPPFSRHMIGFPTIAADAKRLGVEILNCSPISAIDVFPKVSLQEALDASRNTQSVEPTVDSGLTRPTGDVGLRAGISPGAV
jgi:hypothetical protein